MCQRCKHVLLPTGLLNTGCYAMFNALVHQTIQDLSEISFSELTQLVAGFLLDSNPPHEDVRINVNQQTQVILCSMFASPLQTHTRNYQVCTCCVRVLVMLGVVAKRSLGRHARGNWLETQIRTNVKLCHRSRFLSCPRLAPTCQLTRSHPEGIAERCTVWLPKPPLAYFAWRC